MVREELQTNGYYFGNLSEINPNLLEKLENLKVLLNRDFYTKITHSFVGTNSNKIESTHTDTFYEAELVKNEWLLKKQKGLDVWQIFYTFNNNNHIGSELLQNLIPIIREIFLEIVKYSYGYEMLGKILEINRNLINVTNFTKGCFIEDHSDGGNPNMVCNILVYLNDDWESENGGELIVKNKYLIQPRWGNFAILDFVKHNPSHSVNSILKSDINRFAVLTGILLK